MIKQKSIANAQSFKVKVMTYTVMTSFSTIGAIAIPSLSHASTSAVSYADPAYISSQLHIASVSSGSHINEAFPGLVRRGIIGSIFHGITSVFHNIIHSFTSVVRGVVHAATSFVGGIVHAATSLIGGVVNTGLSLISHTIPIVGPLIGAVGSTISHVVGTVAGQFLPSFDNGIAGLIPPVVTNAIGGALSLGSVFSQTLGSFFPVVGHIVGGVIGGVVGAVGGALTPIASGVVSNVVEGASNVVHSIVSGGEPEEASPLDTPEESTPDADAVPELSTPDAGTVSATQLQVVPQSSAPISAVYVPQREDATPSEPEVSLLG